MGPLRLILADSIELQQIKDKLKEKDLELKFNWDRGRLRDVSIGILSTQEPLVMFEAIGWNDLEMWGLNDDI